MQAQHEPSDGIQDGAHIRAHATCWFSFFMARLDRMVQHIEAIHNEVCSGGQPPASRSTPGHISANSAVELTKAIEALLAREEFLGQAAQELKEQTRLLLLEQLIRPLVSHLAPICDYALEARQRLEEVGAGALEDASTVLDHLHSQVNELLASYGVKQFEARPGDPFDRRTMTVVQDLGAGEQAEASSWMVTTSLRPGLRYGDTILRPALVTVHSLTDNQDSQEMNLTKREQCYEPSRS